MSFSNIQPKITHLINENQIKKAFDLLIEVLNHYPELKIQINNFDLLRYQIESGQQKLGDDIIFDRAVKNSIIDVLSYLKDS